MRNLIFALLVIAGLATACFLRTEAPLPDLPEPKFFALTVVPDRDTGMAPGIVMDDESFRKILKYSNELRWRAMGGK